MQEVAATAFLTTLTSNLENERHTNLGHAAKAQKATMMPSAATNRQYDAQEP